MKLTGFSPLYADLDGLKTHILSPWSDNGKPLACDRVMDGDWIYLGSFEDGKILCIDFISMKGFEQIARWRVDQHAKYVDQTHFSSSRIGLSDRYPNYSHKNTPQNLALLARGKSNDLQIYFAIRYLLRDEAAAAAVMNAHSPNQVANCHISAPAPGAIKIHTVVVFNHNYARNIPHLDEIYSGRFATVTYVLPNIAPYSSRCLSFPVGSYSFHTLVYYAVDALLKRGAVDPEAWYLFTQDDVYLNKNFSQENAARYFTPTTGFSSFYHINLTGKWNYQSDWIWNNRTLNSLEKQSDPTYGNGFEGFKPLMHKDLLFNGVSDLFVISGSYLQEFSIILGNYIGQNIFPEVSIPSTLRNLAMFTETKIGLFRGEYLWREDPKKFNEEYVKAFDLSDKLFLHPVKLSLMQPTGL